MNRIRLRSNRGVTLMELMVVMTIVGVLASIAVPTYRQYAVRTHRAAARACLSEYAQFMERYYTSNLTYDGAEDTVLGCATEGGLDQQYQFSVPAFTQRTYTLQAEPINAQAAKDQACAILTLQENGTRGAGPSGDDSSAAILAQCW